MVSLVSAGVFVYIVYDLLAGPDRQRVPSMYIRIPIIPRYNNTFNAI